MAANRSDMSDDTTSSEAANRIAGWNYIPSTHDVWALGHMKFLIAQLRAHLAQVDAAKGEAKG